MKIIIKNNRINVKINITEWKLLWLSLVVMKWSIRFYQGFQSSELNNNKNIIKH